MSVLSTFGRPDESQSDLRFTSSTPQFASNIPKAPPMDFAAMRKIRNRQKKKVSTYV